ncbi:MAG TPA: phosphoenolpyruvate carboxykinase [Candidatus Brocadiia bacterium]|nr:phosphoenolpyruvate carboxykinase [Planctomycetota bacterium]MDO8094143.1 phosphoenolpyruvate carboxykinase [Candidatus Brocadiales bacterium]
MINFDEILKKVKELQYKPNVKHPSAEEAKREAEKFGTETCFGSYNFVSTVKNRSAGLTVYIGPPHVMDRKWSIRQNEIINNAQKTVENLMHYMEKAPFVCVKRTMGDNTYFTPQCTLYVSVHRKEMIRLAHMWGQTLHSQKDTPGPEQYLIYIPEWQEKDRQILVFPEINVTFVLGSDYYGESKKGHLRMGMWNAKKAGMLGLHAGAKIIKARDSVTGKLKRYGMLIFGLTATGKTTHTCHDHGLTGKGEGIEILQDDVVFFHPSGAAYGTEKGFYLKTEGLNPDTQKVIYKAAVSPNTIFENVFVDYEGNVDFNNDTLTGNGRGVIQRDDLGEYRAKGINLSSVNELDGLIIAFIVRRNTVVPIVSKLTPEQAAAAFMLGESIESSGGDPKRAGESVREVGTNPFIIGDLSWEGNLFYKLIKANEAKIQFYQLNTGGVGEIIEQDGNGNKIIKRHVTRVQIPEMASIIRSIARGAMEWVDEPYFGTKVPKGVDGIDVDRFNLSKFYSQNRVEELVKHLVSERIEYIERFKGLEPKVFNTIKNQYH